MSRSYYQAGPKRTVTVVDASVPANPETVTADTPATGLPAGVWNCDGLNFLVCDVTPVGNTGGTIQILAWDSVLQVWIIDTTLTVATGNANQRFKILNWCSRFAFAQVTAITATSYTVSLQGSSQGGA